MPTKNATSRVIRYWDSSFPAELIPEMMWLSVMFLVVLDGLGVAVTVTVWADLVVIHDAITLAVPGRQKCRRV